MFQIFETMCYQSFSQSKHTINQQHMLLERILATLLAKSFDGDFFVSQSGFDAYAGCARPISNFDLAAAISKLCNFTLISW